MLYKYLKYLLHTESSNFAFSWYKVIHTLLLLQGIKSLFHQAWLQKFHFLHSWRVTYFFVSQLWRDMELISAVHCVISENFSHVVEKSEKLKSSSSGSPESWLPVSKKYAHAPSVAIFIFKKYKSHLFDINGFLKI